MHIYRLTWIQLVPGVKHEARIHQMYQILISYITHGPRDPSLGLRLGTCQDNYGIFAAIFVLLTLIFHSDLNNLVQIKSVFACTVMEFHPSAFSEWFFFLTLMDDITPNVSFNFEDIYFQVKFQINLFPHPHYLVVNR